MTGGFGLVLISSGGWKVCYRFFVMCGRPDSSTHCANSKRLSAYYYFYDTVSPLAVFLCISFCVMGEAVAQKVRVAMRPEHDVPQLLCRGQIWRLQAEGLDVSLEVVKTEIGVAGMVAGEIDYTSAMVQPCGPRYWSADKSHHVQHGQSAHLYVCQAGESSRLRN